MQIDIFMHHDSETSFLAWILIGIVSPRKQKPNLCPVTPVRRVSKLEGANEGMVPTRLREGRGLSYGLSNFSAWGFPLFL